MEDMEMNLNQQNLETVDGGAKVPDVPTPDAIAYFVRICIDRKMTPHQAALAVMHKFGLPLMIAEEEVAKYWNRI